MLTNRYIKKLNIVFILILICITHAFASDEPQVVAISNFESSKYLGKWYEIARIPFSFEDGCIAPITATYTVDPNNSSQLIVENKCSQLNNPAKISSGIASFVESQTIGKLEVNFLPKWISWMPFSSGDYWIIYTDYTNYAIVGSPNHKYMWVLSRSETFDTAKLNKLLLMAEVQGFDINKLIYNYKVENPKANTSKDTP